MRKNQENGKKMSKICSFAHCEKNRDPPLKAQGVYLVRACESLLRAYEVLCCGSAQYIEYTQFTPKTLAFAFPESVRPVVGSICRNGQVLVFGQFPHTVYTVYTGIVRVPIFLAPLCYDGCSHPEHKWPAVRPESLYGVSLPRLWVTVCCL